ncbi:MAG: MarR family transcriptional regulator [Ruminococcus sp.]|nr:MarR family transcriptional regulator [Ruminococcus sp.]
MDERYEPLRLCNQLCFPLYAASREIVSRYKPVLDELELTYTQYIAMLVLWEQGTVSVKELGRALYLDSGTLTPVLKKLEQKGLLDRRRDTSDERVLNVTVTEAGLALRERALSVPERVACTLEITEDEAVCLYRILNKLLRGGEE